MATTLNRGSSWTNGDGLVVGFGPNKPVKEGAPQKTFGAVQTRSVTFTYDDMSGVNVPVPAGSRVVDVHLEVSETFLDGTSLTVGDGSDADGFVLAADAGVASLVAGAKIPAKGVYSVGATDTGAAELKLYGSADTIDLAVNGTFTAGKARLVVSFV